MRLLITIDGKSYEIDNVFSYAFAQGKYEEYDTVIEIVTLSEAEEIVDAPTEGTIAEGVRKPSELGVRMPQIKKMPLSESEEETFANERRGALGVTVIGHPKGKVVSSHTVKTKARKLDSANPIHEAVEDLVSEERLLLSNPDMQALLITVPAEIRIRKDSIYILEKVVVYQIVEKAE